MISAPRELQRQILSFFVFYSPEIQAIGAEEKGSRIYWQPNLRSNQETQGQEIHLRLPLKHVPTTEQTIPPQDEFLDLWSPLFFIKYIDFFLIRCSFASYFPPLSQNGLFYPNHKGSLRNVPKNLFYPRSQAQSRPFLAFQWNAWIGLLRWVQIAVLPNPNLWS